MASAVGAPGGMAFDTLLNVNALWRNVPAAV